MDAALTLEQAQKAIRQCEAIQDNKTFWRGDSSSDSITVDVFKGKQNLINTPRKQQQVVLPNNVLHVEGGTVKETMSSM